MPTGRNLVVCFDGTDNQFGATNTNIVRLYQAMRRDPAVQIGLYDPGVGTMGEPGTITTTARRIQMILGLAFGLGVTQNVSDAYRFLMQAYGPDDRIFIFGFSRGALEARALAGLIHRCGLLHPHLVPLEPYAIRFFQTPGDFKVVRAFQATFARRVDVTFLGLWDTVTSMGNVWSPITWPFTTSNPSVRSVAHAIAIDERRAFFRQNRWKPTEGQQCTEVWFAGVHSDVGGGYPVAEGRLWAITLRWMAGHASRAGLLLDDADLEAALAEGADTNGTTPDCATNQHDSLTLAWKPLELVPRFRKEERPDGTWVSRLVIPAAGSGFAGRPRSLRGGERVHRSAIERFVAVGTYRPPTLTRAGLTLPLAQQFLETTDEEWIVPHHAGH